MRIIQVLKKKLIIKKQKPLTMQQNRKYVTFTYHSPLIMKVTNLFKQTNLSIALQASNTIQKQLTEKLANNNPSGIYKLKCNTWNNAYIGQFDRSVTVRHKEHTLRTN